MNKTAWFSSNLWRSLNLLCAAKPFSSAFQYHSTVFPIVSKYVRIPCKMGYTEYVCVTWLRYTVSVMEKTNPGYQWVWQCVVQVAQKMTQSIITQLHVSYGARIHVPLGFVVDVYGQKICIRVHYLHVSINDVIKSRHYSFGRSLFTFFGSIITRPGAPKLINAASDGQVYCWSGRTLLLIQLNYRTWDVIRRCSFIGAIVPCNDAWAKCDLRVHSTHETVCLIDLLQGDWASWTLVTRRPSRVDEMWLCVMHLHAKCSCLKCNAHSKCWKQRSLQLCFVLTFENINDIQEGSFTKPENSHIVYADNVKGILSYTPVCRGCSFTNLNVPLLDQVTPVDKCKTLTYDFLYLGAATNFEDLCSVAGYFPWERQLVFTIIAKHFKSLSNRWSTNLICDLSAEITVFKQSEDHKYLTQTTVYRHKRRQSIMQYLLKL
jgi:hypothetical protein